MNNLILNKNELASSSINETILKNWLQNLDCKESSLNTYKRAIRTFLQFLLDDHIEQPTKEDIINYKNSLFAKGLKVTTIQNNLRAVKSLFNYLSEEELYKNIAKEVKTPKTTKGFKADYLTKPQAQELLQSIDTSTTSGKRDFAIIALALTCGLRANEIAQANICDIQTKGSNKVIYILGKGYNDKESFVILPTATEKAIRAYLATRTIKDTKEPLFVSCSNHNENGRLTTRSLSRLFKNYALSIGLTSEKLHFHSCRHTAATLAYLNGARIEEVSQFLRHQSITTTQIYLHAIEKDNNTCSNLIANDLL